jgi:polar amino acid transport system substrate-binding protein
MGMMPNESRLRRASVLIFFLAGLVLLAGCGAHRQDTAESGMIAADETVLRVGITPAAPPLIFKQGNKITGLEADFARDLAKSLGKTVRFVELEWEDQIPALLDNRIDIIMSGMTRTPLREVRISFCIPYLTSGQMALIRREDAARFSTGFFSLATSSAIGVIKDTTGEYFVETSYSSVKKIAYSTPKPAVEDLVDKRIDMFIYDGPMILYLASENEANGLTALFAPLTEEYLAWAVNKDDTDLLKSANEFLRTRNEEGKLNQMIQHWIPFAR